MFKTLAFVIFWCAILYGKYYLILVSWVVWEIAGGFKVTALLWFTSIANKRRRDGRFY